MARIHIEQIKGKERTFIFEEKPGSFPALANLMKNSECSFLTPVRTHLRAIHIGDLVEAEGSIETRVQLACSRCLNDFQYRVQSEFAITYTREIPEADTELSNTEIKLSYEDLGLNYFSGEQINLQPNIAEQVILAMPIQPLCSAACKGLCTKCGADLNKDECHCDQSPLNNQFAALRNLKLEK